MRCSALVCASSTLAMVAAMPGMLAAEPFQMLASDLVFSGTERAEDEDITRNAGETVSFLDDSSAANAAIIVNEGGAARFRDRATAEDAAITNNAETIFENSATAGRAAIVNNGAGTIVFAGDSTAGEASAENSGSLAFRERSTAGSAFITNNESGTLEFSGNADAGGAELLTNSGFVMFRDEARAGRRFIVNNEGGQVSFEGEASAAEAEFANSGTIAFRDRSTLETGEIVGNEGSSTAFSGEASAAEGTIAHAGVLTFSDNATAGSALIETQSGGVTYFSGNASGGLAEMRLQDDAVLDFSGLTSGGTSVGSLLGTGRVFLGGVELTVGGNELMTTVGGLSDGGVAGGTGGSLVKVGGAILRLEGENSYTGATVVREGTLQAASENAFAPGSAVTVEAGAVLDVAGFDQEIGSLAGEGAVDLADNILTLGGDGLSTEFSGTFTGGAGGFTKTGAGVFRVSGESEIEGPTSVTGGTLVLDGSLALSAVSVNGAGTIAGSGRAFSLDVGEGGTLLSRGPSLDIVGDLMLGEGALHSVLLSPELSAVTVGGAATIDGTDLVVLAGSSFDLNTAYTLIEAEGGLSGRYGEVVSDFAFLAPQLIYGDESLTLTLQRNDLSFAEGGRTPNQRSVAAALDGLAADDPLLRSILLLGVDAAPVAFDQLSGEAHASVRTGLIEDARHVRRAAEGRLRSVLDAPHQAFSSSGPHDGLAYPSAASLNGWAAGFGSQGETSGDGNAAALDRDTAGVLIGLDGLFDGRWQLGFLAGYSQSDFSVAERASGATAESFHAGLYGGTRIGQASVRAGATYSLHDIELARAIVFPGFDDNASSSYDAWTGQVFGEAGYTLALGAAEVEPFAGLAHVHLSTDGFAEDGGAAALAGRSARSDVTFSTLGFRTSSRLVLGGIDVTARSMVGWRHAFGDRVPEATLALGSGGAFTVSGIPIAKDTAVVELGFDIDLSSVSTIAIGYAGQFGGGADDHGVSGSFLYRF